MQRKPRVVNLVIDAMGLKTLEYLLDRHSGSVHLPNLAQMGLGNLIAQRHQSRIIPVTSPDLAVALRQASAEADSVVGHREMCCLVDNNQFDLFYGGFPRPYIQALEKRIGKGTIFNKMSGGSDAIEQNRREHKRTGKPIVYASVCDPLIQIATDEEIISVAEAHRICDIAFDLAWEMGVKITRAIARTYVVKDDGTVVRTANRHDKVLPIEDPMLIDILKQYGVQTISVGKPAELVPGSWDRKIKLSDPSQLDPSLGLQFVHPDKKDTNPYTIQGVINALNDTRSYTGGVLIFANCVDTDSVFGHTQDVRGSLRSLQEVDRNIKLILEAMDQGDLLLVTADHGMLHAGDLDYHTHLKGSKFWDYGYHSKEPLPLLGARKDGTPNDVTVPSRETLASVGHIIAQTFDVVASYEQCSQYQF